MFFALCRSRRAIVAGVTLFTVFAGTALAERRGNDPLSRDEIHRVTRALASAAPAARKTSNPAATQARLAAANPQQLLLVERRPLDKGVGGSVRHADVYHYDYSRNLLIHSIVDVARSSVVDRYELRNVQLPLVDEEIVRATELLMASPGHRARIASAYRRTTGNEFTAIGDLDYKAFVFHADTSSATTATDCGMHRCAQLLLYTPENTSLDLSPIVDLTLGKVVDVLVPDIAEPATGPRIRSYDTPLGDRTPRRVRHAH